MTWLRDLWFRLSNIWKSDTDIIPSSHDAITPYRLIDSTDRLSFAEVEDNIVYHVGAEEWKWLLMFKCPCGCGDVIHLSLLKKSKQFWKLEKLNDNQFSIHPSIDRTVGCKSHFFIKENKVEWCGLSELY